MYDVLLLLDLCHSSSLPTRSVALIFCDLLQHHISIRNGAFDLLSEVPRFQFHTKLCFKCVTLLVSSLNLSWICRWKGILLSPCNPEFNARLHLAPFVIVLPKEFKYFTLFTCSFIYHKFGGDGCLEILITLVFSTLISILQHLPLSSVCSLLFIATVKIVVCGLAMVLIVSAVSFISSLCSLAGATHKKPRMATVGHWIAASLFQALAVLRCLPIPAST